MKVVAQHEDWLGRAKVRGSEAIAGWVLSDETDMQMAAREGFAKLRALRSRIPRARRTSALQQLRQAGDVLKHRRRGAVRRQRQRHRPRRGPRDPGQRRVVRRFLRGRQRDAHLPHRRRVHLRTAHDSPARVGRLPRRLSLRSGRLVVPVRCAAGCTVRSRLTPLKAGPAPHGSSAEAALRTAPHGHPRTSWHLHVLVPCQVFATLSPAGRGVSPQRLVIETERVSATRG